MTNQTFLDFGQVATLVSTDIVPMQRGVSTDAIYRYMTMEQLADYVNDAGGGAVWGNITGTLSNQTDLAAALALKAPLSGATMVGATVNGLAFTALSTGFTIAGGTASRTLTVSGNADVSGTNTGDVTIATANGLALSGQALTLNVASNVNFGAVRVDGTTITASNGVISSVGTGTVNSVSVTSANGFSGSVATATTTPAITIGTTISGILIGNGTAIAAATASQIATALTGSTIEGTTIGRTSITQALPSVVTLAGTSKTLALTDSNTIQDCTSDSSVTIAIPLNSSIAFAVNTVLVIQQSGAGTVTITGDTGVTVNGVSGGSVNTTGQYTALFIRKTGADTWEGVRGINSITALTGDVTASGIGSVAATVGSIGGKTVTLAGALTTTGGAFDLAFTMAANTNLTLPTSGTLLAAGIQNAYAAALSTSMLQFTGALLTGGTGTTTFPALYFNNGATPLNTLSLNGTYIGINSASGFTGNFLDFYINNGGSRFSVASTGAIVSASTLNCGGTITTSGSITAASGSLTLGATNSIVFTGNARISCTGSNAISIRNAANSADAALTASTVTHSANNGALFTNQTSAAAAQSATLTNAPTAGNPGYWLRVTINGTNYALPAWAA